MQYHQPLVSRSHAPPEEDPPVGDIDGSGTADLDGMSQSELAKAAQNAYDNAQDALKDGDWAAYGEYMDELEGYLDKLAE